MTAQTAPHEQIARLLANLSGHSLDRLRPETREQILAAAELALGDTAAWIAREGDTPGMAAADPKREAESTIALSNLERGVSLLTGYDPNWHEARETVLAILSACTGGTWYVAEGG